MHPPHLGYGYEMSAGQCQRVAPDPPESAQGNTLPGGLLGQRLGIPLSHLQHIAGLILAEQQALIGTGKAEKGTDAAQEAHLGHGHGEPTIR